MSYSVTLTNSITFTETHARHIAAKVSTDLKRIQRFYGSPSDVAIANYEIELVAMLKAGYLGTVSYGYRRDNAWIEPTLKYTAHDLAGASANDDNPGRIRTGANTTGATFYSYMTYSPAWNMLTSAQQDAFAGSLPFRRGGAPEPAINGYLSEDKTYSAGGRAVNRAVVRSY